MFQRLQTVYILLAIVAIALSAVFNIANYTASKDSAELTFSVSVSGIKAELSGDDKKGNELSEIRDVPEKFIEAKGLSKYFKMGLLLVVSAIGLLLFMLLKYKNLKLQLRLGRILFLLFLIGFVSLIFAADLGNDVLKKTLDGAVIMPEFETGYGVGLFMPMVAAAFVFLANLRIKNDMKLLASIDRIR